MREQDFLPGEGATVENAISRLYRNDGSQWTQCTVIKLWKPVARFLVKTGCARLFARSKDVKQRVFY